MAQHPINFIPPQQSRQLTELAERARVSLTRFAGIEVEYNAIGLQLLDEWIDRHLKQFPEPSKEIVMVWGLSSVKLFADASMANGALTRREEKPTLV